jgi:Uma2 family endonuclease
MTHPEKRSRLLTVDEYLRMEERATVRHEYVAGRVYAMSGVTIRHSLIVGNVYAKLRAAAAGGSCRVVFTDVKVRVSQDVFYYPDLAVACEPVGEEDIYLREPCLVGEVTSPSTATRDHREKLLSYRQLPSLRSYLIVAQSRRKVERRWRSDDGMWRSEVIAGTGSFDVPCPATMLSLDEIYEGVTLPSIGERAPAAYTR